MVEKTVKTVFLDICEGLKPVTEDYMFEGAELCSHFLKINKSVLPLNGGKVSDNEDKMLKDALLKRARGYPLQYILGEWDFYGRTFLVGEGVLIPRADTETLIDVIKSYAAKKSELYIADLCSGSGCIAITISKEFDTKEVFALEKSPLAYSYLLQNIKQLDAKVTPILADVLEFNAIDKMLDIVVSNPPYIKSSEIEALQKELSYEPQMALDGMNDGLFFYREITKIWAEKIKPGGILCYEIGQGQERDVQNILLQYGFKTVCQCADLCGIIRVVYAIK